MEKFEAYYDEDAGKSRIDYYDGLDKTFQLANENKMVKIVPMTTETGMFTFKLQKYRQNYSFFQFGTNAIVLPYPAPAKNRFKCNPFYRT